MSSKTEASALVSKEGTISKEPTPSAISSPSKSQPIHPSGSIRSIMNLSSPTPPETTTPSSKYTRSDNSPKLIQGQNLVPEETAQKIDTNQKNNVPTEPEQEGISNTDKPSNTTSKTATPFFNIDPSLKQLLSQTLNIKDFKDWPYSEDLLRSLISLKTEQERTKREWHRSETLQRSLEVLDHASRSGVPGYLIPSIFQGSKSQTLSPSRGLKVDTQTRFQGGYARSGNIPAKNSLFQTNISENQPINYQFHHWQNPENSEEPESLQQDVNDKKRKNSVGETPSGTVKRSMDIVQRHRRNQSDNITVQTNRPYSEASEYSFPQQHKLQSELASATKISSPYSSRSQQDQSPRRHIQQQQQRYQYPSHPSYYQYPPHQNQHVVYQYPAAPHQFQTSPNRYFETPPTTSVYQFPPAPFAPQGHGTSSSAHVSQKQQNNLLPPHNLQYPVPPQQQQHQGIQQGYSSKVSLVGDQQQQQTGKVNSHRRSLTLGNSNSQGVEQVSFLISTPMNPPK